MGSGLDRAFGNYLVEMGNFVSLKYPTQVMFSRSIMPAHRLRIWSVSKVASECERTGFHKAVPKPAITKC